MADAPETLDMEVLCMQMIVDAGSAKSDYMEALQAVKAGDIIEVTFGNRPIKVKVLSDVEPRTKDVAREMYEIIEQDNVLAAAHDAPKAE